jgi:hypothetical protein
LEHIVCDALARLENSINQELVVFARVPKTDVRLGFCVDVCLISIRLRDFLLRLNHLADVNSSCVRAVLQVIVEQLELVGQIVRVLDLLVKV